MGESKVMSDQQRAGVERLHADHLRIHEAIQVLENAVGSPFPHRAQEWLQDVREALGKFRIAVGREYRQEADPTGILEMIRHSEPRLAHEVNRIEERYEELARRTSDLAARLEKAAPESIDIAAVREEISDLLSDYKQLQAREVDVIYDAYLSDIGVGD